MEINPVAEGLDDRDNPRLEGRPGHGLPLTRGLTHPFIARDESFLLVRGLGLSLAKIIYRRSDDSWSSPIEFNDRVETHGALFPCVRSNARFFFVTTSEYFLVEAPFIAELRPKEK